MLKTLAREKTKTSVIARKLIRRRSVNNYDLIQRTGVFERTSSDAQVRNG
jgi:hypothetical protein